MGLYDQKTAHTQSFEYETSRSDTALVSFIKDTYKLFGASMMAAAAGAYTTMPYFSTIINNQLGLFILEIALLIGLLVLKRKAVINMVLLFAFTFMTGVTLVPLLTMAITVDPAIIGNAFGMTALVFGAMSLFAIKTPTDFTTYTNL